MKPTSQVYVIELSANWPQEVLTVQMKTEHNGTVSFQVRDVCIEYRKEGDRQWKWVRIAATGSALRGTPCGTAWKPGDSTVPLWAVALAHQYYPRSAV
jgi:hypothetical protein